MADFSDSIPLPEKRDALEHLIEAAIARLDELDDDPDLEPSLGSVAGAMWGGTYWPPAWVAERTLQVPDECEEVTEDEGAACDDEGAEDDGQEPSLGALEHDSQLQWGWNPPYIDAEENGDEFEDDRCALPPGATPKARPPGPVANTAEKCLEAAHCLRMIQRTHGKPLSPLPIVIAGALFKR